MFCRFCGATLPDGSAFCRSCGHTLKQEAKPGPVPVQGTAQPVPVMGNAMPQSAPMNPGPVAAQRKSPVLAIMIVLTSLMTVFTAGCFLYQWM